MTLSWISTNVLTLKWNKKEVHSLIFPIWDQMFSSEFFVSVIVVLENFCFDLNLNIFALVDDFADAAAAPTHKKILFCKILELFFLWATKNCANFYHSSSGAAFSSKGERMKNKRRVNLQTFFQILVFELSFGNFIVFGLTVQIFSTSDVDWCESIPGCTRWYKEAGIDK